MSQGTSLQELTLCKCQEHIRKSNGTAHSSSFKFKMAWMEYPAAECSPRVQRSPADFCVFFSLSLSGHSHQLFHICGIIGTYFQMESLLIDMTDRHDRLLAFSPSPSFSQTLGPMVASLTISLLIIAAFSTTLYSVPKFSKREKHKD